MMAGRTTEETPRMFLWGVEMVARYSSVGTGGSGKRESEAPEPAPVETWRRIAVAPGVELNLREGLPRPRPGEVEKLLAAL